MAVARVALPGSERKREEGARVVGIPNLSEIIHLPVTVNPPHFKGRGVPDVSGDADPATGNQIHVVYTAGPGWDACTGLGSPDGANLLQAFGARRGGIAQPVAE